MQLKELLNDDRAVSPVIGVILMVAITVILAAVIGTFVLGLGDQVSQTTPSTSFTTDYEPGSNDSLTIAHNGGETLTANQVNVTINGADGDSVNSTTSWTEFPDTDSEISAGSSVIVNSTTVADGNLDLSGATVRVVWQTAEGGSSAQLGTWSGPDA